MSVQDSNFLRLISIIAVLIIHSTHYSQVQFSKNLDFYSSDFFYVILNQISRFSVPVFIILSGYGLTVRYSEKINIHEFYQRRFIRIGIPFLFWTFAILLFQQKFNLDFDFFKKFIYYLTITGVDYHLYFLIIILQCYMIFPLLVQINSFFVLLFLFIFQIYNYSPTDLFFYFFNYKYFAFHSTFLFSWLFYFYFGIYLRKNEKKIKEFLQSKKIKISISILLLISMFIVNFEYFYKSFFNSEFYLFDHFHRYSVFFYSVFFFLFYFAISPILNYSQKIILGINNLAEVSFSVYLFHTWILRVLDLYIASYVGIKTLFLILVSFFLFFLIKKFINFLESKINFSFIKIIKILLGI